MDASAALSHTENNRELRSDLRSFDGVLIAMLVGLFVGTLLLHDIAYILSHPFWQDEAWVAVLSYLPAGELRERATGVPLGWLLLMRFVPGDGDERFRLLPLAFSAASVVVAGILAYSLEWRHRWQARAATLTVGFAAALTPVALNRNDLKHYTADAFFALLVLVMASRLNQSWTRRRLAVLVAVGITSALLSYASMFVTGAVILGMLTMCVRNDTSKLPSVMKAGAITGLAFLIIGAWIVLPGTPPELYDYWNSFYLRGDLIDIATSAWRRFGEVATATGVRHALAGATLCLLGLFALARLKRSLVMASILILFAEMVLLGVLQKYPFLQVRTSHFMIIILVVAATIGVTYAVIGMANRPPAAFLGTLVILMALTALGADDIRKHSIPNQDVRAQVRYVEAEMTQGDTVLVNLTGSRGVVYYWRGGSPEFVENSNLSNGWMTQLPREDFVFALDRTESAIREALIQAIARTRDSGGRLWVIRSHVTDSEAEAWERAFADLSIEPILLPVGPEPLAVVDL